MSNRFSRILIIQTAFIGDVILTTSLIEKLNEYYPQAKIDFLLRKGNQILLQGNPKINEVLIWDKKKKYRDAFRIISIINRKNYDLLINGQRHFTTGFISLFSKAGYKIGFSSNPLSFAYKEKYPFVIDRNSGLHEVDRLHKLIEKITDNIPARPVLYLKDSDRQKISNLVGNDFITIHPGSIWRTKQLPMDKWTALIRYLDPKVSVYLLGGPGEKELCSQIVTEAGRDHVYNKAGELNLMESAALMKLAKVNYVNDSAPLHICSAIDAPCVSVFCSTIPEFGFFPLATNSRVVQHRGDLYCRPCGVHGRVKCPEGHFRCGQEISLEDLSPDSFLSS